MTVLHRQQKLVAELKGEARAEKSRAHTVTDAEMAARCARAVRRAVLQLARSLRKWGRLGEKYTGLPGKGQWAWQLGRRVRCADGAWALCAGRPSKKARVTSLSGKRSPEREQKSASPAPPAKAKVAAAASPAPSAKKFIKPKNVL